MPVCGTEQVKPTEFMRIKYGAEKKKKRKCLGSTALIFQGLVLYWDFGSQRQKGKVYSDNALLKGRL